ncbi:ROK family protein [Pseudonocardia acidicola]|uniref:ROK family protein n=1 Tax=Pseudonocardia acidicola TaxID=2724939 RepID=A0ABX1S750_9PSEU|nr:ROK family protein [Pseudonocardia acidicola]NMH97388.1 ROK family protein [Pseudonocardia acidicola]
MTGPARAAQAAVIALDVGGTAIKGALETRDGVVHRRIDLPTPVADGVGAVLAAVVTAAEELRPAPGDLLTARGAGLIFPGVVDSSAGVARFSANIGWRDLPIRRLVSERVGVPVAIDHDVRAAGLAEARLGTGRGVDEFLFLAIGTGIAGAVVTRGSVVAGASCTAGELGHLPVHPSGDRCACGQLGCTEAYASAAALPRRYLAQGGAGPVRAEDVIARAGRGDRIAQRVLDEAIVALGRALVIYTLVMDPALVVIGGGLARAGAALTEPLRDEVERGLAFRPAPRIVISDLGSDAGRRGAALVAWKALDEHA